MKKYELKSWREKEIAEIGAEIRTLSARLTGAYLARSANKLQNSSMIKDLRRDIAWLQTIKREKEISVDAETVSEGQS